MNTLDQEFLQRKTSRRNFIRIGSYGLGLAGLTALGVPSFLMGQTNQGTEIRQPQKRNWEARYFDMPPEQFEQLNAFLKDHDRAQQYLMKRAETAESELNPFFQPLDTTIYVGSLDVDSNGTQGDSNDISLMQSGTQNDMADADGDGIPSTAADILIAQNYLNGNILYPPAFWNHLQTTGERNSWNDFMQAIDLTDEIPYQSGQWVSGDYMLQLEMNFAKRINHDDANIPDKYGLSNLGRFNMPIYGANIFNDSGWGHGMNAILIGNNPLDFTHWCFIEPQTDDTNVQPGGWNIPYNTTVAITALDGFYENGGPMFIPIVYFNIDDEGNPDQYYNHPNLILERPTVSIANEKPRNALEYKLSQNSPNPFNGRTTIKYSLPSDEHVVLDIYNTNGRFVKTIFNERQSAGDHEINIDLNGAASGTYLYQLRGKDSRVSSVGKMTLVK